LAGAEAQFRAALAKDQRCSDAHIELGLKPARPGTPHRRISHTRTRSQPP
jgi:hypothetical protein